MGFKMEKSGDICVDLVSRYKTFVLLIIFFFEIGNLVTDAFGANDTCFGSTDVNDFSPRTSIR